MGSQRWSIDKSSAPVLHPRAPLSPRRVDLDGEGIPARRQLVSEVRRCGEADGYSAVRVLPATVAKVITSRVSEELRPYAPGCVGTTYKREVSLRA